MYKLWFCTALLGVLVWAPSPSAIARQDEQAKYFTDVELVGQDGKARRLYTDLMKGKVVLIAPLHVRCTSIGPPMMRNLAAIQKALGNRAGSQVHILTITVDPGAETPEKVGAYARSLDPGPGWFFLSGTKENVDVALRKFGLYVDDPGSHSGLLIVGNLSTGLWKKAYGLAKAEELIPIVESVIADKGKQP